MAGGGQQVVEKMAPKAVQALDENLTALAYFPSPHLLLAKLRNLDPIPPKLLG